MMAHCDHTSRLCLELAMAATAYGKHRGRAVQLRLSSTIHTVLPLLPHSAAALPSKEDAEHLVRSALTCGRSAGLSWHDMAAIFNDVNEHVAPALPDAMKQLQKTVNGERLQ